MHNFICKTILIENCQCSSYEVSVPNPKVYKEYFSDSLKRIVVAKESMFEDDMKLDSFYYDEQNLIREKKSFYLSKGTYEYLGKLIYSYTASGKIAQTKRIDIDNKVREVEKFSWDTKNRPLLFTITYYHSDTVSESYELRFNHISDTISLLEYWGKKIRSTSKRVYNRQGRLVQEYVEKKSEGSKVSYAYQYTKEGKLHSVHKVKVIGADIPSFETYPYIHLLDMARKIEYSYDNKGRLSGYKIYNNIALDKVFTYKIIYKD